MTVASGSSVGRFLLYVYNLELKGEMQPHHQEYVLLSVIKIVVFKAGHGGACL